MNMLEMLSVVIMATLFVTLTIIVGWITEERKIAAITSFITIIASVMYIVMR